MFLELHTVSRDNLFEATAIYEDGKVTVQKGSRINLKYSDAFKPSELVMTAIKDPEIVDSNGNVIKDMFVNRSNICGGENLKWNDYVENA